MNETQNHDPEYTVVVCNLNMASTLEVSLDSILSQIGSDYELLVVDGGSTDGSLEILRDFSQHDERVRVVRTEESDRSSLGADRNTGVREARGDHILVQLDADDRYEPVIEDFVEIYETLRASCDREFYLSGHGINIAPRKFLLSYGPYRDDIDRGEDADMWRRMLSDDVLVQLDHDSVFQPMGYEPNSITLVQQRFSELTGDFQSGVTLFSRFRQGLNKTSHKMKILECLLIPLAYVNAYRYTRYSVPEPYNDARVLDKQLAEIEGTIEELTGDCDSFNREDLSLSERGREVFLFRYQH